MSVFLDAIKVLEERGWHQGSYEGPDGSVCIEAACLLATGHQISAVGYFQAKWWPVLHGVASQRVSDFNDDPSTSYEDVVLLLKRAHEAWESR